MFADVVAPALKAVGDPLEAPLPSGLLELAKAEESSPEGSGGALGAKPHPDHVPTLMSLAHDRWSSSYRRYEDDHFPIAHRRLPRGGTKLLWR
jgi:hypothetical protein